MFHLAASFGLASSLLLASLAPPLAQVEPYCGVGQEPGYAFGFAALKAELGEVMGQPTSCEYGDPNGSGDTLQNTTQGLAFYRKSTNTPTFTNGWEHWALTPSGLVFWTGTSIDPPSILSQITSNVGSGAVRTPSESVNPELAPLLSLVNEARAAHSLGPLAENKFLSRAAQTYAETMAATGCFSHSCPPVPRLDDRLRQAGYTELGWRGENILWGAQTARQAHEMWMGSSKHRTNVLRPEFRAIGLGLARDSADRLYWVQTFGS